MTSKYLSLDIGAKTLGLAVSNSGIIAQAHKTIYFDFDDYNRMYNLLKKELSYIMPSYIVIGYPKNMNNTEGTRCLISQKIKTRLENDYPNIVIVLEDERLTTDQSFLVMKDLNKSIKDKKRLKDELSAQIILQTFLDRQNANK